MQMTIHPYLIGKTWVFDDEQTGLKQEPFVLGMSEALSLLVASKGVPNADTGFALTFSDDPFVAYDVELNWLRSDEPGTPSPGNWYRGLLRGQLIEGWLCPALYLYFPKAPRKLFVRADPLPDGVDPIWHIDADDPAARRFVEADDFQ